MRWPTLALAGAISVVFFIMAATAPTDDAAMLWAFGGAMVPSVFFAIEALLRMMKWRAMGRQLGLVQVPGGAYPDLHGRYKGRRLHISRRPNPLGRPRQMTRVAFEGNPDMRLPGIVASADAVRHLLMPLLPEHQGARGGIDADEEADDGPAVQER